MKFLKWSDLSSNDQISVLQRPRSKTGQRKSVISIVNDVRERGDSALLHYTQLFDGCALSHLKVSPEELELAASRVEQSFQDALAVAMGNIESFHSQQISKPYTIERSSGIILSREIRPLRRVGFYIPGGSAPLVSTLMMLVIPARLSGCEEIILCTPPDKNGQIHDAILAAAHKLGLKEIYKVGGAQAIAAMAYGTESIAKVDKIFGPGNSWVTEAKVLVSQEPNGSAIDMPAGPSELMVVADEGCDPRFVAADLLSQAEHGEDSQVILVSLSPKLHSQILAAIEDMLGKLSRRDVIRSVLNHSLSIQVRDLEEALALIDTYAPEHLSLQVKNPEALIPRIRSAGSVFCGPWTPEAAGDYASGTNHVLPTGGWCKSLSGLSVESFQRSFAVQTLSQAALLDLGRTLCTLAKTEGLDAHEAAIQVRLDFARSSGAFGDAEQ